MQEQYKGYTIICLTKDNLHYLQRLSQKVWGYTPDLHMLYLKYYHPNAEHAFLGYFAFDSTGEVACFQGACRVEIAYQQQTEIVAQSIDTMVHPSHRGKGLISYIAEKTYHLCKEKKMIGIIGFPNQNFQPIMIKMGFKVTNYLQAYSITVNTFPLQKISNKFSLLQKVYHTYKTSIFAPYQIPLQMPYSFSKEENSVLLRDDTLIEYKKARGTFTLKIENTLLWVKISNGLFIGDMQSPNEQEWLRVIQKLKQLCFWAGIRTINFQSTKGSKEETFFSTHYPSFQSLPLCYLPFTDTFPFDEWKATFGDIDIF